MDWSAITEALWGLFALVLIGVISALGVIARSLISQAQEWILAKIKSINDEATKNAATSALQTIDDLVLSVVTSLEQEYAKAIRESIANGDGQYTRDDLVKLHEVAVARVKETVSNETREAAIALVSNLDQYISDKVSAAVYQIKLSVNTISCE